MAQTIAGITRWASDEPPSAHCLPDADVVCIGLVRMVVVPMIRDYQIIGLFLALGAAATWWDWMVMP